MSQEEAQPVHDNAPDMLERFLVGEEYIADHPEIVRRNRRAMELADRFNRVWASDPEAGESILRELLGGIGENTTVRAPIQIDYGTNLTIGSRTFINFGLTALDVVPITIEDGCWLGGGVIVCPGVTIGRRSVIGAGAVVTRDIPPFSLAVGNPARVIRALR